MPETKEAQKSQSRSSAALKVMSFFPKAVPGRKNRE
jgi:hypothetical protein